MKPTTQNTGPDFAGAYPSSSPSIVPGIDFHESAVSTLCFVEDSVIYKCLIAARRASDLDLRDLHGTPISWPQLVAIFSLKHCRDEDISQRLEHARVAYTITSPVEPGAEAVDLPVQNERAVQHAKGLYWCYTCAEPRPFKTYGAWRKHEKEHEMIYKCKLGGLEQFSAAPPGSSAANHAPLCPSSCKRRHNMVIHVMKHHGVGAADMAKDLAKSFRELTSKKYWSCGFCIHLFDSFNDRLDHLRDHFEHRTTWDSWCLTTEVQGLLCQPMVIEAWAPLLVAGHGQEWSELFSPGSKGVQQLRDRLQMGAADVEDAKRLADTALASSNFNQSLAAPDLGNSLPTNYSDMASEDHLSQPALWADMPAKDGLFSPDTMGDDILSMDPNFTPFPDFSDSQNEFWIDEEGRE